MKKEAKKRGSDILLILIALIVLFIFTNQITLSGLAGKPGCGDGVCSKKENIGNCPADCAPPGPCGDGVCNNGEDCNTCPQDCMKETVYSCGDGVCNSGEDCNTCAADCSSGIIPAGGTCDVCFKGKCDGICHPKKEKVDCADCSQETSYCCGQYFCDSAYCNANCGSEGQVIACCGDLTCEGSETMANCEVDCWCIPSQEVCDEIDNDCDGLIDEDLTQLCGLTDIGECEYGTQICNNGWWEPCEGAIYPVNETCDALDNDCDGLIDEDLTQLCGLTDIGECKYGTKSCNNGQWGTCRGAVNPVTETCDGLDNDCDSSTDNNLPIACWSASDCGVSGWTGSVYCGADGNVHRNWISYQCNSSGTCYSSCSDQTTDQIYESCSAGCSDGQCLSNATAACLDTDGGINYNVNGTCSDIPYGGNYHYYPDICYTLDQQNWNHVKEFYCNPDDECQMEIYECPDRCVDGYCCTGAGCGPEPSVCASYFRTVNSTDMVQGTWSDTNQSTSSKTACYNFMEPMLDEINCAQISETEFITIALITESKHTFYMPELDESELVHSQNCTPVYIPPGG